MQANNFVNQAFLGDCLEIMKQIPDKSVDMILTDLPYGVTARNEWDKQLPINELWQHWNKVKKLTTPIILTAIQPFSSFLVSSNLNNFKYQWIWQKEQGTGFLNANIQPLRTHEQVLVFYEKIPTYNPQKTRSKPYSASRRQFSTNYREQKKTTTQHQGNRYPTDIIFCNRDAGLHPTQKPVALFEYLIKTYTNEGDLILDCCAGSGTTAIACINTNRNYLCIEKEQQYYEIMLKRISKKQNHKLEVFCN